MLKSLKIAKHSILPIAVVVLLQHFMYIIMVAAEKSFTENEVEYLEEYTTFDPFTGSDYEHRRDQQPQTIEHLESLALYVEPSNNQWRDGSAIPKEVCGIHGDHMHLIYVPTEAVDKYGWVVRMTEDKSTRVTPVKVCCPGYGLLRWRGERLCIPVCDNCRNGQCVAPNVCECYNEFVRNDSDDCVFACPVACLNGRCYLDGSCQCDPGYKLDDTRQYCRPICSKGCGIDPLHNCTAPEVCGCIKGFTLTDGGCKPVCEPECGPGGECQAFGITRQCVCYQGYRLQDGVCQSDCYQTCNNGICYNRNRCICNPGYVYHERTRNCIPE